jgi:hypothetical protein
MNNLTPFDIEAQQDRDNDRRHLDAIRKKEDAALWEWIMSGPNGRKFIWRLLQSCGIGESSFNTNGSLMSFAEGRKSVGYGIEKQVKQVAPKAYLTMLEENT